MSENHPGTLVRADVILKSLRSDLSQRHIDEAFENKLIKLGSRILKKGEKISSDSKINIDALNLIIEKSRHSSSKFNLLELAKGPGWVAVHKPPGIAANPISLFDEKTVSQWALSRYPETSEAFPEFQAALCPHRLDTETEGVQIVALTKTAFDDWRGAFSKKQIKKQYLAWCWGNPNKSEWSIDWSIGHHQKRRELMVALNSSAVRFRDPVQQAQTEVKVLEKRRDIFLAEVTIYTGVTHQIRVHLSASGFPLVGDELYDEKWSERAHNEPHHKLLALRLIRKEICIEADTSLTQKFMGF